MQNPFSRAIYGVDVMLDSRFKPKILEVRLKYFPVWRLVPWISLQDIVRKPALNFSSWTPDCVFHKGTGIITIVGADCVVLLVLAVRLSGRGFRRGASSAFFGFFCTVGNSCERATNGNSFSLLGAFLHFFICFVSRFRVSCFFRSVTSKFESLPFLQVYRVSTIVLSWRWFLGQTGSFMREAIFFWNF